MRWAHTAREASRLRARGKNSGNMASMPSIQPKTPFSYIVSGFLPLALNGERHLNPSLVDAPQIAVSIVVISG